MMMRAALIDDEPRSRARMRMFIGRHPEVEIVAEAADGNEGLRVIAQHRPDVVFLDVQMPELSGVEMLRKLEPEERPLVVFMTAHDRYAVDAFDVGALHYLIKPFDSGDVDTAVNRVEAALAGQAARGTLSGMLEQVRNHDREEKPQRIAVRRDGRVLLLRIEQIDWIEAAGNYTRLHVGGKHHLVRETMAALEKKLDGRRFVRIHRSALVNVQRIAELHATSHGDYAVVLEDGTRLMLSRGYRERLEKLLGRI